MAPGLKNNLPLILLLVLTAIIPPSPSQDRAGLPHPPQRITSHPLQDRSPALSPNGKWLLFASNRSGNWDLFIKSTEQGPPIRLTSDLTNEYSPVWCGDGKSIAFVSNREDALGEIYTAKIRLGKAPKLTKILRITHRLGFEDEPAYSPDGKILAFVSGRSGTREIWRYDFKNQDERLLVAGPAVSPDFSPYGDLAFIRISLDFPAGEVFILKDYKSNSEPVQVTFSNKVNCEPCFSPNGNALTVARVMRDTDGDGTLSPQDKFSLWIVPLDSVSSNYKAEFQLTVENESNRQPEWGRNKRIYYTNLRDNSSDIFEINADGIFTREPTAEAQLSAAEASASLPEYYPLALEAVKGYYAQSEAAGWALYRKALFYYRQNNPRLAQSYLRMVMRDYGQYSELNYFAEMGLLKIISGYEEKTDGSLAPLENPSGFITALDNMAARQPPDEALMEIKMLQADALLQIGVFSEALKVYQKVISDFRRFPNYCAQAQCRMAEVFRRFGGETSEVVHSYLKTLDNYPQVVFWNQYAIEQVLRLEIKDDLFAGCQNIIGKYRSYPQLTLSAKLKMAQKLEQAGQQDLAAAEYEQIIAYPGGNPIFETLKAHASFNLADIIFRQGDFIRATEILEKVITGIKGYEAEARSRLFQVYTKRGGEMLQTQDPQLANAMFDKARRVLPEKPEGHRGYIAAMNKLSRGKAAYKEYSDSVKVNPDNAVLLYCQGLALSYISAGNTDELQKSTEIIRRALELDYSLIPAHLTISYNYEALEMLKSAGRIKKSIPRKIVNFSYEALAEFWRALTFQGEPPEFSGYELAINSLCHAVLINDETTCPELEAGLYRNLGNCYYALGEFGFNSALEAYRKMLIYQTAFESDTAKAVISERMGRSAMYRDDFNEARLRLESAKSAFTILGDANSVFRILLLQAENELLAGDGETSNQYFTAAVAQAKLAGIAAPQSMYFSNTAFNWYASGEWDFALQACNQALAGFEGQKLKKSSANRPKVRFSALGFDLPVSIPIPSIAIGNLNIGGSRSIDGFDLADIKSLALAIKASALEKQAESAEEELVLQEKIELSAVKKNPEETAAGWNNLAVIDFIRSDFQQAAEKWLKSIESAKKAKLEAPIYHNTINLQFILPSLIEGSAVKHQSETTVNKVVNDILAEAADSPQRLLFSQSKALILAYSGGSDYGKGKDYFYRASIDSIMLGYRLIERAVNKWQEAKSRFERSGDQKSAMRMAVNLAAASMLFADFIDGEKRLQAVLKKAEKEDYDDLVWQTLKLLGDAHLHRGENGLSQAESDYDAAIDLFIKSDPKTIVSSPSAAQMAVDLINRALRLKMNLGKEDEAFHLAELLSAVEFSWMSSKRDFSVKGERRKYYWSGGGGNINFLRKETARLKDLLHRAKFKPDRRAEMTGSLRNLQNEYVTTLINAAAEDMEFAALFTPAAPTVQQIQSALTLEEALIRFCLSEDTLFIWCLTKDDFAAFHIEAIVQEDTFDLKTEKKIFDTLKDYLDFYPKLMIAGEIQRFAAPFQNLLYNNQSLYNNYQITQAHTASAFYYARLKRNIGGGNIVSCGIPKQVFAGLEGYNFIALENAADKTEAVERLKKGDIIILKAVCDSEKAVEINQGFKLNFIDNEVRIANYEQFDWELAAPIALLVDVDLNSGGGSFLTRSLLFAGITGIISFSPQAPDSVKYRYIRTFLEYLPDNSPLAAHQSALNACPQCAPCAIYWGDGGMSSSEKAEFAKVNFQKTVLLGNKNLQEKSYDWAQRYYTQALEMARRLMDNQAEANLYQLLIRAAYLGQDWEKAAALQQERLNSAAAGIAPAPGWENLSYFNLQLNRWRETLQCADNAAEIYISTAEYRKAAQAYQTIALGLESKNNYASAILCAEKSRDIVRRYNLSDTEQIEILLAKLNFEAGKISQAEDILTALFREGAISPGRRFFANLLMARSKFAALDYSAAMEYFLQALNLADKDSLLQRSQAFQGLADVNYRLNDYTAALAFIDTARACCENIPSGTAYLSFNTEALTLWKMGRLKAAGDAFQRALDSVIKSTDRKSEASIRRNYSAFLCKADDHQKALFQINLALENSRTVKDSVQQACDLLIIAGIQLQTGEAAKAKAALDQFSALMGKESPPLLKTKYLFLQSYYEYSQGQYRRAGEMLAPVLEDKVSWQLPEMNWRICLLMGMINDKLKKSAEAVNYYEQSMTSLQKLTCPRWDGEIITVVMDDVWTAFEKAAETALLNGDFSACRDIMEKRNALREKFAVAERGLKLRTRQAYSYEEANLRSNIESLQRQLESAAETEADTLDAVLKSVRLKHSELLNTIQNWDPGYYRAVSGSPLFTQNKEYENKLAQFLLSCNAGIIEYSVFPSNIYACLTTSDTLIGRKIDLSRQNLRFYGNIMRQSIEGRLNIELQAKMFYEKLLQPFEAELSGKENLIIIPDDALWQLPFDALMDDKGIWAIDKWSISLEFSLDAIISGLEKHASGSEDIVLYAAAEAPGMQKLEFAEREVESIAFTLPQAEVYFTGSISGEELKKRCQQSAITHLACHGKDVSGAPIDYCLMLTQKGAAGLSARELYGWETDAELFFLSACGKGIFSDTDYFELSLPQALMFAGAGAVISSLWKVDDLAAAALAKRCYRLIAEGKSKADALRTAKLFLKDRINPHPSFWAAFQLYGNRAGWSKFNKGDYNLHYSGITK